MEETVKPKWSELPERTKYSGGVNYGDWAEIPGRFTAESHERCTDVYYNVCTLCWCMVGDDYGTMDKHTDYHKSQGE